MPRMINGGPLSPFDPRLTEREAQILPFVANGLRDKEIGKACGITVSTVKCHLRNIREKLGLTTRVELALRVWTEGRKAPANYNP